MWNQQPQTQGFGFGAPQQSMQPQQAIQNPFYKVPEIANDSISCLRFAPSADILAASSWDGEVRIWEVQKNQHGTNDSNFFYAAPKMKLSHNAPILCLAISSDGKIFTAGCDNTIRMYAYGNQTPTVIGTHDSPIKCMHYAEEYRMLITASWDKTVRYWDVNAPSRPQAVVQLPERAYCSSYRAGFLVIGCAERLIAPYDLRSPQVLFNGGKPMLSNLKYQTRAIGLFCDPGVSGFAIGSIEGRVACQHFGPENIVKSKDFAFKCHRDNDGKDIYPVNAIAFHPYGTFATAGGDGRFHFWDKDSKQRLHQFQDKQPNPIVDGSFNRDGTIFAAAVSYDWAQGPTKYVKGQNNAILLHNVTDAEIKSRPATKK